jgi:hypothetical protein
MEFLRYELQSDIICMGEGLRAGWFRPCVRTIPYSQVTGALRRSSGEEDLHAAGHLAHYSIDYLSHGPRDRVRDISKIPLRVQVLREVRGSVYVLANEAGLLLPEEFELFMGGLRSKGFGHCHLRRLGSVPDGASCAPGTLNTRIPLECRDLFGIRDVQMPVYGYLFKPTSLYDGDYVLALFEGSKVVAPAFLLSEFEGDEKRRDARVDDIQALCERIRGSDRVWKQRGEYIRYSANFLDSVGGILATHGFGVADVFLTTREERRESTQAAGLKEVLRLLQACPRIQRNRAIGRLIIKSLLVLQPRQAGPSSDHRRPRT